MAFNESKYQKNFCSSKHIEHKSFASLRVEMLQHVVLPLLIEAFLLLRTKVFNNCLHLLKNGKKSSRYFSFRCSIATLHSSFQRIQMKSNSWDYKQRWNTSFFGKQSIYTETETPYDLIPSTRFTKCTHRFFIWQQSSLIHTRRVEKSSISWGEIISNVVYPKRNVRRGPTTMVSSVRR